MHNSVRGTGLKLITIFRPLLSMDVIDRFIDGQIRKKIDVAKKIDQNDCTLLFFHVVLV